MTDLLVAGRVGRPHGLDGSFHVAEAAPGLLAVDLAVDLDGVATKVVALKGTADNPIVRLALAADRDAAEALRGRHLRVDRAVAGPLDDDEYWADDLAGCAVVTDGGRALGTVARMLPYPSCDLLELEDGTLVPLVRDAIRDVDLAARRIEVDAAFLGLEA